MPPFESGENDVLLRTEDLPYATRSNTNPRRPFGAFALLQSSRSAEQREVRAIERQQRKLNREKRRLENVQRLRQFARRIMLWSR